MRSVTLAILAMVAGAGVVPAACAAQPSEPVHQSATVSEQTRVELLAARDQAWRAFFTEDGADLKSLLGPELIAIQQHQEEWENRERLLALAESIRRNKVKILRLEFPHTEIQVFGDVAVLYYTYIFETGVGTRSGIDQGRGTEIFVRRDGKWVDVGWHLDSGAFKRRGEEWIRMGTASPPSGK